ncbi:MAG: rRNA maturation RNase YbeY [Pirellulaceae bacterium]|nr:rRNA maturation RNase YbeY [Planctomycetales bacterium]
MNTADTVICLEWHLADTTVPVDRQRFASAVQRILAGSRFARATISVAILDNPQIQQLNRRHLQHDYPTDVLSFLFDERDDQVEGEIIISAEMARQQAPRYQWAAEDELLLYFVHGMLHLIGHDDHADEDRARMRAAEASVLNGLGMEARWREVTTAGAPASASEGDGKS